MVPSYFIKRRVTQPDNFPIIMEEELVIEKSKKKKELACYKC